MCHFLQRWTDKGLWSTKFSAADYCEYSAWVFGFSFYILDWLQYFCVSIHALMMVRIAVTLIFTVNYGSLYVTFFPWLTYEKSDLLVCQCITFLQFIILYLYAVCYFYANEFLFHVCIVVLISNTVDILHCCGDGCVNDVYYSYALGMQNYEWRNMCKIIVTMQVLA